MSEGASSVDEPSVIIHFFRPTVGERSFSASSVCVSSVRVTVVNVWSVLLSVSTSLLVLGPGMFCLFCFLSVP